MYNYSLHKADRPRIEGDYFTYPYDLGWKENFKQVQDIYSHILASYCPKCYLSSGVV